MVAVGPERSTPVLAPVVAWGKSPSICYIHWLTAPSDWPLARDQRLPGRGAQNWSEKRGLKFTC